MTGKLTFVFDVDGVVADFIAGAVQVMNELLGESRFCVADVDVWEIESLMPSHLHEAYRQRLCGPGFAASLAPYQDAVHLVCALRDAGHIIEFATSPLRESPTWISERTRWLCDRFGDVPIHYLRDKSPARGHCFVDDKPEHVEEWAAANPAGLAFLMDRPYNRAATLLASNARRVSRIGEAARLTLEMTRQLSVDVPA